MKTLIIALILGLIIGCCSNTGNLEITDVNGKVATWENVYTARIEFDPWYTRRGKWEISATIKHPQCGEFRVSEKGDDLNKVFKAIDERIKCLNECK